MLRYLVGQSLAGRPEPLKEYVIGTEVLERPPTFDPRTDSVVRVEAHRLRVRLSDYYAGDGQYDQVVIGLPRGGYTLEFTARPVEQSAPRGVEAAVPGSADAAPTRSTPRRVALMAGVASIVVASIVAGVLWDRARPKQPSAVTTIAVLPFAVAGDDPLDRQLAQGFADELTTALAGFKSLRVVARSSASQFRDATEDYAGLASRLGVGRVVRGSLRRVGGRLRLNVQLISVPDSYHVWAESFERGEGELGTLVEEITWDVAGALGVPESGRTPRLAGRPAAAAYSLYLKGRSFRSQATPEALLQSAALFEAATASDPSYALAHAALADVHATLAFHGLEPPAEAIAKARAAADRALSLDDAIAEAHSALALIRFSHDWDWPSAERAYRRAIELNPSAVRTRIWYAVGLVTQHRGDEAVEQMAVARQLDPLSLTGESDLAMILFFARRYQEAMFHARRALESNPRISVAHVLVGECLAATGRHAEAIEEFRKAIDPSERFSLVVGRLGYALAMAGRRGEARTLLAQLEAAPVRSGTPNTEMAFIYAGMGEKDRVFECLEKAFAAREGELLFLGVAPTFDAVRGDARFLDLTRRVGLPSPTIPSRR